MKFITILLLIFIFGSCTPTNEKLNAEIAVLKSELEERNKELSKFKSSKKTGLIHEVYFNLKDDLTVVQKNNFEKEILRLEEIGQVKNFQFGQFHNLKDPRAFSDYEMIIKMEFEKPSDYQIYQNHQIHLGVKGKLKEYLAGPPGAYDYFVLN